MNAIEINGLIKKLGDFKLDIDNFEIEKGIITGFVGKNGAGKSTTINLIMNFLRRDSGNIKILGKEYTGKELNIKEKIGYIGDKSGFMKESRLKDIKNSISLFYKNWDEELYNNLIKKFELDESKVYKDCSKGQQRKFDITMALSHKPEILIMDEPTSNLDPVVRDEFIEIIQNIMEKYEMTVFYSTHITSDLENVCDSIAFIEDGKIFLKGYRDDIIDSHKIVKGRLELLDNETRKYFISIDENKFGFEGLTNDCESVFELMGEEATYSRPKIEDLLKFYIRR
ncbi:ABC transporter ATP-binding protein [Peptacetobacter sp.]|uniref:ABC transporter ATP-binding protein n=1 Tax=Peptacetobacter sp. TaxID=2991975 RepID=UPI00261A3AF1|nr:ABC transporter ATP-binding protein [Peptacetobacter sp.]